MVCAAPRLPSSMHIWQARRIARALTGTSLVHHYPEKSLNRLGPIGVGRHKTIGICIMLAVVRCLNLK